MKTWLPLAFLALVALQALLVILDRTGVPLPLPARALSGVRLAVALQILLVVVGWMLRDRLRPVEGSGRDDEVTSRRPE